MNGGVILTLRSPYLRGKSADYPLAMRLYRTPSLLSWILFLFAM
jgi:hypothetical protein